MNRLDLFRCSVWLAALAALVALCLWVPWDYATNGNRSPAGYGWLWAPPELPPGTYGGREISLARLGVSLLALVAVAGTVLAITGRPRRADGPALDGPAGPESSALPPPATGHSAAPGSIRRSAARRP